MSDPQAGDVVLIFARASTTPSNLACVMPRGATLFSSTRGDPDALVVSEGDARVDVLTHALSPRFLVSSVVHCRPTGTLPVATEEQASRGLLVGATDCGDPSRIDEFHDFYDRVHAREVLDTRLYWRGRRFERIAGDATLPRFFALYDAVSPEPDTFRELQSRPMTRVWPDVFLVRNVWTFNVMT